MIGSVARTRLVRMVLALVAGLAVVILIFLWCLNAGPIRLVFLDRPIVEALGDLAPELVAEVERTELARSGRGVVLRVSGVRLARRDGTAIITLPRLSIRPRLSALLRGRIEVGRVSLSDARLALTRTPEGELLLGMDEAAGGLAISSLLATPAAGVGSTDRRLPRIALRRVTVTLDDRRAGGRVELADAEALFDPRDGGLEATLTAALTMTSAAPPLRGEVKLPVRGYARATLGRGGGFEGLDFTLTGGTGGLATPPDAGTPLALEELEIVGVYDPRTETVALRRLAVAVGSARLDAKGTATLSAPPVLRLDGTLDMLAIANLTQLWPIAVATAARAWLVDNVRKGVLRCRFALELAGVATPTENAPGGSARSSSSAANAIDVTCDFDGVTADYLRPLAPLRGAAGSVRLTADRLEVDVAAGEIGACHVDAGRLTMDLAREPPIAKVSADVTGASTDVLALVDQPPLGFAGRIGIVPKDLGGQSRVHAELRLPVKTGLTAAEVETTATAALEQASVPALIAGVGITNGRLDLRLDGRRIEVKGTTRLVGVPDVTAPVTVALTAEPGGGNDDQRVTLALDGDGLVVRGAATLAGPTLMMLSVERLRLGRNDLSGTLRRSPAGDYRLTLAGPSLDLESVLADPPMVASSAGALAAGYTVELRLERVLASRDIELRNLRGSVQASGGRIGNLAVTGSLAPSGSFQASLDGRGDARRVAVSSDQAGRIFAALGVPDRIVGGRLTLTGTTDERGPQALLDGELVVDDFRVVRAPVLAKILGIGSLGGVAALLQGEGLPVTEARVPFRWTAGRLDFHDARAIGAVGLTGDGVMDRTAGTCDVRGNVIPAYTLNTALGRIPLLGTLFSGAKDQGIFGIAYRVSGALSDPEVHVDPLATVAPSMLRKWFVDPFVDRPQRAGVIGAPKRER